MSARWLIESKAHAGYFLAPEPRPLGRDGRHAGYEVGTYSRTLALAFESREDCHSFLLEHTQGEDFKPVEA